jgi:hypothetical protein
LKKYHKYEIIKESEEFMKNIQKRHILLVIVIVITGVLIWRLSSSYAAVDIGYSGRNIISGDKWGVNIVEVGEVTTEGNAILTKDVSTIGTTLNFDVALFKPGDAVSFDITVSNTSTLPAELYALTLSGLSDIDGELISYSILPIDSSIIHEEKRDGSILKSGDKQMFNIKVSYDENASLLNDNEYSLSLGSTIIYKQK